MFNNHNNFYIEDILGSRARIKILKILSKYNELSISTIISKTKLNHSNVLKHLILLKDFNLIQEKRFGRIRIFRYKDENMRARSLKRFINIWENESR